MFDISLTEILLVLVVAVIFLGPEEIPRIVKMLAKLMRSLRYISGEVKRVVDEVINTEDVNALGRSSSPRKFILDDQGNYREIYDIEDFLPERAAELPVMEHLSETEKEEQSTAVKP